VAGPADVAAIAFMHHQTRNEAVDLVAETAAWLEADGHEVRIRKDDAGGALSRWAVADEALLDALDLAVSVGGDGTMLRTVHLVCGAAVPVMGVNVGHLGYLTEFEPDGMRDALRRWLGGDHRTESRMTLEVRVLRPDQPIVTRFALNDAVLQRTGAGHTVRLATSIDGGHFVTYSADGLIVATPTGSTAYNLSARGPIVSPRHRALVVTPVSPHMLFNLSLVLDGDEQVRMDVLDGLPAELVVDGQSIASLEAGAAVEVSAGRHDAILVSYSPREFHHIVMAKFGLPER
jgi:NAD+ kinase